MGTENKYFTMGPRKNSEYCIVLHIANDLWQQQCVGAAREFGTNQFIKPIAILIGQ